MKLGDRAPDENALVFDYIDGLKENARTEILLQRPNLLPQAEQLAERADAALFRKGQQKRQGLQQLKQQ